MAAAVVSIRTLTQAELGTAAELRARMNREMDEYHDATHPGWRERFCAFFKQRMDAERAALFVAELDGAICGLASVYLMVNHRTEIFHHPTAYVTSVFVVPEQRRKKIATQLMAACIQWAKEHGCDQVRLRSSEMGRPVYLGMGFSPSNELELRLNP